MSIALKLTLSLQLFSFIFANKIITSFAVFLIKKLFSFHFNSYLIKSTRSLFFCKNQDLVWRWIFPVFVDSFICQHYLKIAGKLKVELENVNWFSCIFHLFSTLRSSYQISLKTRKLLKYLIFIYKNKSDLFLVQLLL